MAKVKLPDQWLVIGAGSLTGSRFIELSDGLIYGAGGALDADIPKVLDFWELDITNPDKVKEVISQFPGKYVINFAGITLVDKVEETRPKDPNDQAQLEQNLAYRVNVLGTKYLAKACKDAGKFPIFISTGFVFDGENGPYSEDDPVADSLDKVGWYAWTKILAEKEVEQSGVGGLTIRISYPYRSEYGEKTDFARAMLAVYDDYKVGKRDSIYPFFADQTLTPTFTDDIPAAAALLVEKNATGIFHLTSPEITTPYDFCLELLRIARGEENPEGLIKKGSIVEFQKAHPELAKRPIKGGEKSDKIIALGFEPASWKDGIRKAFEK